MAPVLVLVLLLVVVVVLRRQVLPQAKQFVDDDAVGFSLPACLAGATCERCCDSALRSYAQAMIDFSSSTADRVW